MARKIGSSVAARLRGCFTYCGGGIVVTVLVAWGIALAPSTLETSGEESRCQASSGVWLSVYHDQAFGMEQWQVSQADLGPMGCFPAEAVWDRFQEVPLSKDRVPMDLAPSDPHKAALMLRYGWPMKAMHCEVIVGQEIEDENGLSWQWGEHRFGVPIGIAWGGLAGNASLFALAIGITHLGIASILRVRRARRGLCSGCGYNRGGLTSDAACPECGSKP